MPEGTIARTRTIFDASMQVLKSNKILLLFPVASLLSFMMFAVFFFGIEPIKNFDLLSGAKVPLSPRAALFYLFVMFVSTFETVAFSHEAMAAFNGDRVSLRRGFAFAMRRIKAILFWSLCAGLVGLLIEKLEERVGWAGKIILRFTGVAWSIASVFAIQVMVREASSNPVELLRKSSASLKKNWGETLAGYVGIGIGMSCWIAILATIAIVALILGPVLVALEFVPAPDPTTRLWLMAAAILALCVSTIVAGTLETIFRCALYIYASEGAVPAPYDEALMDAAWKVKKQDPQ